MVKETPFCGLKNECPLQLWEAFSDICVLIPPRPNNPDYVQMHLFHVSLAGDAKDWYKCLDPNSITTWAQLKTAFLERFYPTVRTQDWRKKIASFTQEDDENLSVAWIRFKRMIRAYPLSWVRGESLEHILLLWAQWLYKGTPRFYGWWATLKGPMQPSEGKDWRGCQK